MAIRKQTERGGAGDKNTLILVMPPVTHSNEAQQTNSTSTYWNHQWINALIRTALWWSNLFSYMWVFWKICQISAISPYVDSLPRLACGISSNFAPTHLEIVEQTLYEWTSSSDHCYMVIILPKRNGESEQPEQWDFCCCHFHILA